MLLIVSCQPKSGNRFQYGILQLWRACCYENKQVPVGTCVSLADTDEVIADFVVHGQVSKIVVGGAKGIGNVHFKSAWNVRPQEYTDGEPGEECVVEVELKSIADVGLVGFPNAGKSTLLRSISNATPKVADYPFTTLKPNLGVLTGKGGMKITVADIPGLVEGAHENKGLGHIFLRHIERCKCLLYVVDISAPDPMHQLNVLQSELLMYKTELSSLPLGVVFNKIDLIKEDNVICWLKDLGLTYVSVSAKYNLNISSLKQYVSNLCMLES